jgi:hypothetical protein
MVHERQLSDLLPLVRRRYEDWDSFSHPAFVRDELAPKRATIAKAAAQLGQAELDNLIAAGDVEEFLARLLRLTRDNDLLWRRVPASGDTAVLHHPALDKPAFCAQVRNLLYGDRPSPDRLQTFADFLLIRDWPNRWPLPTYLLFICHPDSELFVKPQPAAWFLRFMGETESVGRAPEAATYRTLLAHAHELLTVLRPFGATDMVDVQSFLWVCFRESQGVVGRLDAKGQVELDVPPTEPLPDAYSTPTAVAATLREPPANYQTTQLPDYPLTNLAADTGLDEADLLRWRAAIERKGQAIFYGPPGTGKTFLAQKMARHLAGGGDGFIELVQFHPTYAYEDFMQGIRPRTGPDGGLVYEMVNGRFLNFCLQAQQRRDICVFIIDEINRANLAAVFGELMYLLEYRNEAIPLAGGGHFTIPANMRLLGTMNTADRSIALVDHALRRRFAFIPLRPNYDLLRRHAPAGFDPTPLIALLQRLNHQIGDPHYHLGVTYFLRPDLPATLPDIWRTEIEPYLEEYFFDRPDVVEAFRWETMNS